MVDNFSVILKNDLGQCEVVFNFPEGKALLGVLALNKFTDQGWTNKIIMKIMGEFKDDPTIARALNNAGLAIDDDDDDDEDY